MLCAGLKPHRISGTFSSETLEMSVQNDVSQDFASCGEERDSSVVSTVRLAAFVLEQCENGGVLEDLWHVLLLPELVSVGA